MLDRLRADATLYARIANPRGWHCTSFEIDIRNSLEALNTFGVRQPRPLLLALPRLSQQKQSRQHDCGRRSALSSPDDFITTAVVGVSSTGGISVMYARYARQISAAATSQDAHKAIEALINKLHKGLSNRDTFISEFGDALFYSQDKPEKRRLVQYALRNLHDHQRKGYAFDHSKCNIEHISPESEPVPWMSDIGNLLWVDEKLNQKAWESEFSGKAPDSQGLLANLRSCRCSIEIFLGSG